MKRIVVALMLCIPSCNLASFEALNVAKLRHKFQIAALEDEPINRAYRYSKDLENRASGSVDIDVPKDSDLANHPFHDYLWHWRYEFCVVYDGFLFSMSRYAGIKTEFSRLPGRIFRDHVRQSRIKLTMSEWEYVDQHPNEFLELLDETMLKHHVFWPYVRISRFDCASLALPKTKFLNLVENDPHYLRVPRDYLESRKGRIPVIAKFSDWKNFYEMKGR